MKVRYTRRAFADREDIFRFLDRRSPTTARAAKTFIHEGIMALATMPERHPVVRGLDVRMLWLRRYPYLVYYRV